MKNTSNFLLSIDVEQNYDVKKLKEQLDKAIDWLRIVPGVYFIRTTSDSEKWFNRLNEALHNNRFFLIKIDISDDDYVGRLPKEKWDWIEETKSREKAYTAPIENCATNKP